MLKLAMTYIYIYIEFIYCCRDRNYPEVEFDPMIKMLTSYSS